MSKDKKIESVSISVKNEKPESERGEPSHVGFSLEQEFMSLASRRMTKMNANIMKLTFTKCRTMMNRDVMVMIWEPENLTLTQKFVMYLFKKVM